MRRRESEDVEERFLVARIAGSWRSAACAGGRPRCEQGAGGKLPQRRRRRQASSGGSPGSGEAGSSSWRPPSCSSISRSMSTTSPGSAGRPAARRAGAGAAGRSRCRLMRPGERVSTTTRSDRNTASSTLWVTNSTVLRSRSQIRAARSACRCGLRVERAERLVHQQDARPVGERARDRDALLHAAGQLLGIEILVARQMHHLDSSRARALARPAARPARAARTSRCRARSSRETAQTPGIPGRGPAPARPPAGP